MSTFSSTENCKSRV